MFDEFSLKRSSEQHLGLEEKIAIEFTVQNGAGLRDDDGPLQRTVATQTPENNFNDNTGEMQRSIIETCDDSTTAEISSGTPRLPIKESPTEEYLGEDFPWLQSSVNPMSSPGRAHQSIAGQCSSSTAIQGHVEHPSSLTRRLKRNEHLSPLGQQDLITTEPRGRRQDRSPVAGPTTDHRSSSTDPFQIEQASPIEELRRRDHTVRPQRHIKYSRPAFSNRVPEARWSQISVHQLLKGLTGPGSRSTITIQQVFHDPDLSYPPFQGPIPPRRIGPRPHPPTLHDEETNEGAMVHTYQSCHGNFEAIGERMPDGPSPALGERNSEDNNAYVNDWVQTVDNSESHGVATLSRHEYAAIRKAYKEELLDITQAWPEPPTEALVRSLIKLDDEDDNYRQFAINVNDDRIRKDRRNYELYVLRNDGRNPEVHVPVYWELLQDLDILKIWVNMNMHWNRMKRIWPPGYTPQFPDLNERDKRDDLSSICTHDQESILSE